MSISRRRLAALAAGSMLALSSCGTTAPADEGDDSSGGEQITVKDARGTDVKLDGPAKKVVALEWGDAEMLGTLGVNPVGVADAKTYPTWVTAAPLDKGVKHVGTRQEPSIDTIVKLNPDLIVMEEANGDLSAAKKLQKYAPVLVTKGSDASRNLDRMREDFEMIAKAVGKEDKAEEVLGEMDKKFADGKKKIADAGNDGKSFFLADGYNEGGKITIRPFAKGALFSDTLTELGLKNAWPDKGDKAWGLGQTDVEGLTKVKDKDVQFLYNASDAKENVFENDLKKNKIYNSLPFVKNGDAHKIKPGIWTYGGPGSIMQFIDESVKVFGS